MPKGPLPFDELTRHRILQLHPDLRADVLEVAYVCYTRWLPFRISWSMRTSLEQDVIYSFGRTRPGQILTQHRGSYSFHEYGLAFDFCFMIDGIYTDYNSLVGEWWQARWRSVVYEFEKRGWTTGQHFRRPEFGHLQKTFGLTINDLILLKQQNKLDKFNHPVLDIKHGKVDQNSLNWSQGVYESAAN